METGRIIDGRYEVERTLASGGMATVHVVRHLSLDSKHALKILHIPSPDVRERLLLEGRLQARLRHPNIVAVTDTLTIDGAPGLILELVEGPALDEWLASQRPSLDEAEAIFLGILAAVDHAHRHGVVHRDLKPANVLLAPLAGGFLPKVADFGIAKVVEDILGEKGGRQKTRTGVAMGTPAYMSPEQIEGARDLGPAADVFALGCILYELVVGKPAFDGPTLLSILTASREGFYDDPSDVTPDLPERFVAAIRGALAPELDERIPDCATLARVLTAGRVGSLSGGGPVVDARAPFEPRAYPRGLGSNPRRSQETFGAHDLALPRRPDAEPKGPSRDGPSTAAQRWGPLEVDAAAEAQERRRSRRRVVLGLGVAGFVLVAGSLALLLVVSGLVGVAWWGLAPGGFASSGDRGGAAGTAGAGTQASGAGAEGAEATPASGAGAEGAEATPASGAGAEGGEGTPASGAGAEGGEGTPASGAGAEASGTGASGAGTTGTGASVSREGTTGTGASVSREGTTGAGASASGAGTTGTGASASATSTSGSPAAAITGTATTTASTASDPSDPSGFRVTVHGARVERAVSSGVFKHAAPDGRALLLLDVAVQNDGTKGVEPKAPFQLRAGGQTFEAHGACRLAVPGSYSLVPDLPAGREVRGKVCFEVPIGVSSGALVFRPGGGAAPIAAAF